MRGALLRSETPRMKVPERKREIPEGCASPSKDKSCGKPVTGSTSLPRSRFQSHRALKLPQITARNFRQVKAKINQITSFFDSPIARQQQFLLSLHHLSNGIHELQIYRNARVACLALFDTRKKERPPIRYDSHSRSDKLSRARFNKLKLARQCHVLRCLIPEWRTLSSPIQFEQSFVFSID